MIEIRKTEHGYSSSYFCDNPNCDVCGCGTAMHESYLYVAGKVICTDCLKDKLFGNSQEEAN